MSDLDSHLRPSERSSLGMGRERKKNNDKKGKINKISRSGKRKLKRKQKGNRWKKKKKRRKSVARYLNRGRRMYSHLFRVRHNDQTLSTPSGFAPQSCHCSCCPVPLPRKSDCPASSPHEQLACITPGVTPKYIARGHGSPLATRS